MADNKNSITTRRSIGVKTGLHARIAQSELAKEVVPELQPEAMPNRLALMLDCSGSMDGPEIKHLIAAAQDFVTKADYSNTAIAIESFPEGSRMPLVTDSTVLWLTAAGLKASGGTPMSTAMEYVRVNVPLTRGLLISDGAPDNQNSCFNVAESYKASEIPIDTIHIGEGDSGAECLKRISEITGGLYVKFTDVASLMTTLRFLLPENRENAATLFLTAGAKEVQG